MSKLPPFHLLPVSRENVEATGPSAPPLQLCLDLRGSSCGDIPGNAKCPATSRRLGSYNWDRETGGFTLEWEDLAAFELWRRDEERVYSIKLIASSTKSEGRLWSRRQLFVCGRE